SAFMIKVCDVFLRTCPRETLGRVDQKLDQKNEFIANNVGNPSSIALGYVFEKDTISTPPLNISCTMIPYRILR
ncbi:hypothetical protein Tco_1511510, partial [Tanacetum coccineum]